MCRAGNQGQRLFTPGQGIKKKIINTFHFKNEKRFNGVFSRDNLPKLKKGAYVIKYRNTLGCNRYKGR